MKIELPIANFRWPLLQKSRRGNSFPNRQSAIGNRQFQKGSVLVIVLWMAIGLVSIALYFANSMRYELTASDNRVNGVAAEQAIEGGARYVAFVLQNFATNGAMPDNTQFKCEAVPVGDAKFWLIGRDPDNDNPTEPYFGLVDEAGKLSLNSASTNVLEYLPNMTTDFADAIMDWRSTNGTVSLNYAGLGYSPKYAGFETVDELKLVYGAGAELLAGEDLNRNGILDKNEKDLNGNGTLDPGLFEYVTVYTREPNFHSDGSSLTNVNSDSRQKITTLFQNAGISTSRIGELIGTNANHRPYAGMFKFALAFKNASLDTSSFSHIADSITTSTNTYFRNRVNVNTASADVLTALFMGLGQDESTAESAAQTLVTYRRQNPNNLGSIAWVIDALGNSSPICTALARGDYITTKSYQFTADIAAVGAYGRGYRRVKFIFDMSDGSPKILYRQDLSRLGWALGDKTRESLLANNTQ
jgi:DNA uptake protein ComE-like DNA-binding protein